MRRIVRILIALTVVAVLVAVIRRLVGGGGDPGPPVPPWEPLRPEDPMRTENTTEPAPAETPTAAVLADDGPASDWVDPAADGSCPADFPVKAKLSSKIFHVPGGLSYARTGADRCYRDGAAAEADGLRPAKR